MNVPNLTTAAFALLTHEASDGNARLVRAIRCPDGSWILRARIKRSGPDCGLIVIGRGTDSVEAIEDLAGALAPYAESIRQEVSR